jgi:two-component system, LytTR family, sensor kinase
LHDFKRGCETEINERPLLWYFLFYKNIRYEYTYIYRRKQLLPILMNLFRLEKKIIIKHISVWVFLEIVLHVLSPLPGTIPIRIISSLIIRLNTIFSFYFLGLYILPRYWKRYLYLACLVLVGLLLYCLFYYIIGYYILPAIGCSYNTHGTFTGFLNKCLALYFIIAICATAFYLNRRNIFELSKHNEKEKQLLSKELNLLKGQFNSHLTFNFLNFCYGHIYKHSIAAADSIELFSDMLRASLLLPAEEKITLRQEIEYIKNYIKLREALSTNIKVNFSCDGELSGRFVVPRLLVSFLDETMKQYELNNNGKPVNINLGISSDHLLFQTAFPAGLDKTNTINNGGLANIQKILDLFYDNKYKMEEERLTAQCINRLTLCW